MSSIEIWDGIIIGAVGGAAAGIALSLFELLKSWIAEEADKRKAYRWLVANTTPKPGGQYRSTKEIASWNNLTVERTRYICSVHPQILMNAGTSEDMDDLWSVHDRGDKSVYEKRGLRSL
ncbi:hypothetical protein KGO95_03575 [Patescibacteria group bacterium]|nr:hypothetical protein [Patescibacteria group bacterium]